MRHLVAQMEQFDANIKIGDWGPNQIGPHIILSATRVEWVKWVVERPVAYQYSSKACGTGCSLGVACRYPDRARVADVLGAREETLTDCRGPVVQQRDHPRIGR